MIFESERTKAIKEGILEATSSMARIISTSFGPQGLDKMIKKGKDCTITNDGATILKFFKAHPIHNILSSISDTQDINCGDGTTSVVLLTCLLYEKLSIESIENIFAKIEALDIAKKIAIEHIDKVKIPGKQLSNIQDVYRATDLTLTLTKDGEGFGLVPYESALIGTPFVGTNIGAINEFVTDMKNGLLVDPLNIDAIANKIVYALSHTTETANMVNRLKGIIHEKLHPQVLADNLDEFYTSI